MSQSCIRESKMVEIVRSGAIILMGLTVMAAGVAVVFYG
jgi:hypothetical protein